MSCDRTKGSQIAHKAWGRCGPNTFPRARHHGPRRTATGDSRRLPGHGQSRAAAEGHGRPGAGSGTGRRGGGQLAMCWLVYGSGQNGCAHYFLRLGGASLLHGGCFMLWGQRRCPLNFWAPPLAAFLAYLPSEIIVFCFPLGRQGSLWPH